MSLFTTDPVVLKFMRVIAKHSRQVVARKIMADAFHELKTRHGVKQPAEFFKTALQNAAPAVRTKRVVVAGRAIQVPVPLSEAKSQSMGMRFLRDAFRSRKEEWSAKRLANELVQLHAREGKAMNMRENLHKVAESNRMFLHYLNKR